MYYRPKPLVYKTLEEGTPYKSLSLPELEKEFKLLNLIKDYNSSEIGFISYHKKIINSFLKEIKKDLEICRTFLIQNSVYRTYYKTGFFRGLTGANNDQTVWTWKKSIYLKKYVSLLKKPIPYFIFLEHLYSSNGVKINLEKNFFETLEETKDSIFLYGSKYSNLPSALISKKKMLLPKNLNDPIKDLIKAKKYKISENFILKSGSIYIKIFGRWGQENEGGRDSIIEKNFSAIHEILKDFVSIRNRGLKFRKLEKKWIDGSLDILSLDQSQRTTKIASDIYESLEDYRIVSSYNDKSLKKFSDYYLDKNYNHLIRRLELTIRTKTKTEIKKDTKNWVYVLSNKSFSQNYLKIGWTSYPTVKQRAEELSTTGLPFPFKVEYSRKFKDAESFEKKCHKFFSKKRVRGNREFFDVPLSEIKNFVESLKDN
tara:strand:+ start:111 stop:1394 length:1284 start_codon:yes stop_codon:yes gene_type:complete